MDSGQNQIPVPLRVPPGGMDFLVIPPAILLLLCTENPAASLSYGD